MFQDPIDDIVFEHRNKAYGAFWLRKNYVKGLLIGFACALVTSLATVFYMFFSSYFTIDNYTFKNDYIAYVKYDIDQELMKQIEATSNVPKTIMDNELKPAVVVKEEETPVVDKQTTINQPTTPPTDTVTIPPTDINEDTLVADSSTSEFLVAIDTLPRFNGSEHGFRTYLVSMITYPDTALLRKINTGLTIHFIITSEGVAKNITFDNPVAATTKWGKDLARIITQSRGWNPAYSRGKKVSVMYTVPLQFVR